MDGNFAISLAIISLKYKFHSELKMNIKNAIRFDKCFSLFDELVKDDSYTIKYLISYECNLALVWWH